MRLSRGHRAWVYWSGALLLASGCLWLLLHYFVHVPGEFGEAPHPLESWSLRLHGAAAMLVLVVLGSLVPVHVRRGLHQRRNLFPGITLASAAVLLIASGYALYYFGGEEARPWISAFHWVIGLGALPLVLWHIWRGRVAARSKAASLPAASNPASQPKGEAQKQPASHEANLDAVATGSGQRPELQSVAPGAGQSEGSGSHARRTVIDLAES